MDVNVKLAQDDRELLDDPLQYRRIIGKLLYLTITRPDLCYVVNRLSQFLAKSRVLYSQVVVHVLQYIKNTFGQGLFYPTSTSLQLKAFVDANWGTCPHSRKSISGYCVFSWRLIPFLEIQETTHNFEIISSSQGPFNGKCNL